MACFEKINWVIVAEQCKSHHATFMPFSEISIKVWFEIFYTLQIQKRMHRFRENYLSSSKELPHRGGLWEILKFALLKFSYLWACGRGDVSTPSFVSHLDPISTKGGRLCPPYLYWCPHSTPSFKSHRRACCTDIDLFSYQMLISSSTVLAFLLGKKQNEEYLVAFLG